MSDKEGPKPVNVDPRCIQEALRMYLQPIKHDDPQLDFYTMYKRETMEYDAEYIQKHNEDLNTTLIFAGLFSAVSSAFVIDVQSNLQPDPNEQSQAYLRAILLSLNPSIAPDENPSLPPAWNGPPEEIVATLDLLYASLLMSLLAAFVAMLGKQWLNRYLRHAGGSMVERCGDRQRKFDGVEKWPFQMFIESLPVILQIALLLLACGLSRYMWSVNTSVARIVISFTILGVLFYIGIVVVGTSSYECPFQTPASISLRYLRDSWTIQKLVAGLSLPNLISFIHTTRRNTRKLLVNLSLPNTTSFIYATWVDVYQGLVSASSRVHDFTQPREISLSCTISGIRSVATKIGHQIIILLLRIHRKLGNSKQRLVQGIRRFRRGVLLPITVEDVHHQSLASPNGPGLRVRVRDLESIRRRNADNARCVCWVLRNITDPEAIDSAIRLAGTIRWFDGDSDVDPPFDFIVSAFEACFDSARQLYPGMRDRAYSSARAILQINAGARTQSHEGAVKYPIPAVPWHSFQDTIDPDLHHVLFMLKLNFGPDRPSLDFPRAGTNTHTHLLWMSNLFVDLTRVGPNPTLESYESYISAATANHHPAIANTLLVWYMLLGGHVEEETFWAIDKSDSSETILSHLSTRVMDVILGGNPAQHLYYLLEFLAAWEERPTYLTPMAYEWCSAISAMGGRLGERETPIIQPRLSKGCIVVTPIFSPPDFFSPFEPEWLGLKLRLRPQDPASCNFPSTSNREFSQVGPCCDLARFGDAPHQARRASLKDLTPLDYAHLLSVTLEIGFRLVAPDPNPIWYSDQTALCSNGTSHHDWVFKTAFSSHDDEVIADAACAWITGPGRLPFTSYVHYFIKRVERDTPFSPRLRRVSISAIECTLSELEGSALEVVRLLDHLNVDVDDMKDKTAWVSLLIDVMYSLGGPKNLSSHYWDLLDRLASFAQLHQDYGPWAMEVMGLLEETEDWEKLETWAVIVWQSRWTESIEDVGRVTRKLLSQRPSALPRFEDMREVWRVGKKMGDLRQICDQARTEQSSSESPPSQPVRARPLVPFVSAGEIVVLPVPASVAASSDFSSDSGDY